MLPALLNLLVAGLAASLPATTGAAQVPTLDAIPPAIAGTEVPTCLQFTPTHFAARSHTTGDQWLVFQSDESGLQRILRLPPHARVLFPIVAGTAKGVSVEVLYRTLTGTVLASGAIPCEVKAPRTVFVTRTNDQLESWRSRRGGSVLDRAPVERTSGASALARRLQSTAAAHVPVPAPGEHRKRDKSRPLERKKLPPI
jgi:hypothetical protein